MHLLEGYYMPKLNSQCVDSNYLLGVMTNKFFRIKLDHIKVGQLLTQATKQSVWEELQVLQKNFEKPFGLSDESILDKPQLVNIRFTYAPDHKFFRKQMNKEDIAPFTQEEIKLIKQFDFSLRKQSQDSLEHQENYQKTIRRLNKNKNNLEQQLLLKKNQSD